MWINDLAGGFAVSTHMWDENQLIWEFGVVKVKNVLSIFEVVDCKIGCNSNDIVRCSDRNG